MTQALEGLAALQRLKAPAQESEHATALDSTPSMGGAALPPGTAGNSPTAEIEDMCVVELLGLQAQAQAALVALASLQDSIPVDCDQVTSSASTVGV